MIRSVSDPRFSQDNRSIYNDTIALRLTPLNIYQFLIIRITRSATFLKLCFCNYVPYDRFEFSGIGWRISLNEINYTSLCKTRVIARIGNGEDEYASTRVLLVIETDPCNQLSFNLHRAIIITVCLAILFGQNGPPPLWNYNSRRFADHSYSFCTDFQS